MNEVSVHIDTIEKQMKAMSKLPTVQLLMTMPGVGLISAVAIHGEVGDWSRFDAPEKLASYSGLVPSQRSSGSSVRMGHITKTGSHVLRYTMVEAAMKVRNCESHEQLYSFMKELFHFVVRCVLVQRLQERCSPYSGIWCATILPTRIAP